MNKDITLESLGFEVDKLETNEEQIIYCKDILDKNTRTKKEMRESEKIENSNN